MASKESVRITIEGTPGFLKVTVEAEKRPGEFVRNLEIETKQVQVIDNRTGQVVVSRDEKGQPALRDAKTGEIIDESGMTKEEADAFFAAQKRKQTEFEQLIEPTLTEEQKKAMDSPVLPGPNATKEKVE